MEILVYLAIIWLMGVGAKKVVTDSVADWRDGKPTPSSSNAKLPKYGLLDHLTDNWRDMWSRKTDALVAARNAKDLDGDGKVSLRERLVAGKAALEGKAVKVAEKVAPVARGVTTVAVAATRKVVDPVQPKSPPKPAIPEPTPLATEAGDIPDGTKRISPDGTEIWDAQRRTWKPVLDQPSPSRDTPSEPSNGGTPVSAPTGEATNLATAVAEVDALKRDAAVQHDQATACRRHMDAVDQAMDGFQPRQVRMAQTATSLAEHLTERHVDPAIIQPVMDAAEALSPGDVDAALDHIEALKAIFDRVIAKTDAAIGSLDAARRALVGTFADAASVVEEKLSGDSRFLGGENAGAPQPDPSPARRTGKRENVADASARGAERFEREEATR